MTHFNLALKILLTFSVILYFTNIYAWKNHALITEYALKDSNLFLHKNQVKAESLESFLNSTYAHIPPILQKVDQWAIQKSQQHRFQYTSPPEELKFTAQAGDPKIVEKFLLSLRVNPTLKFPLFLQVLPGDKVKDQSQILNNSEVMLKSILNEIGEYQFIRLHEGQTVSALAVLASASDEPDYGTDIHLFDDNIKEFNYQYHFGNQPFGNPHFTFSSQAPFHMGFYHEANIVYKVAEYLKKTYPEYRIKMNLELAQMAFQTGHPYWGLRFLGWALHYIQDLTQPYHNTPLPGYSTADLIGLNILDKLEGALYQSNKKLNDTINVVSNRHFILEKLVYEETVLAKGQKDYSSSVVQFLQNTSQDQNYPVFDDNFIRNVLTKQAVTYTKPTFGSHIFWKVNHDLSAVIAKSFPYEYAVDPKYIFQDSFPALQILNSQPEKARKKMYEITNTLMLNTGSHTRIVVKSILENVNF